MTNADLEQACKLAIAASCSTGHGMTCTELVSELLLDIHELRADNERLAEARALLKRHMTMELLLLDRMHKVQRDSKELPYIGLFRNLQDDSRAFLAHNHDAQDTKESP